MNKKYELSGETKEVAGKILHRIKALVDIEKYGVKAGDLGGFIESENNLSRYGNSWVADDAEIYSNAQVSGNARVAGDALIANEGDYATIKWFGGHKAITFFNCSDYKARAACGSFYGTIPEFREYVKVMCKDKGVEECLLIADLMEKHFDSNTLDVPKDSDSHEDEEVEY